MKIVTINDNEEFLRKPSRKINSDELKSEEVQKLIKEMKKEITDNDGEAGLSAVQAGKHLRIFVAQDYNEKGNPAKVFINPQMEYLGQVKITKEEGCLSIIKENGEMIYGPVSRYRRVRLKYIDEKGKKRKEKFSGFMARLIQHEYDHLDGILFTDKLAK